MILEWMNEWWDDDDDDDNSYHCHKFLSRMYYTVDAKPKTWDATIAYPLIQCRTSENSGNSDR